MKKFLIYLLLFNFNLLLANELEIHYFELDSGARISGIVKMPNGELVVAGGSGLRSNIYKSNVEITEWDLLFIDSTHILPNGIPARRDIVDLRTGVMATDSFGTVYIGEYPLVYFKYRNNFQTKDTIWYGESRTFEFGESRIGKMQIINNNLVKTGWRLNLQNQSPLVYLNNERVSYFDKYNAANGNNFHAIDDERISCLAFEQGVLKFILFNVVTLEVEEYPIDIFLSSNHGYILDNYNLYLASVFKLSDTSFQKRVFRYDLKKNKVDTLYKDPIILKRDNGIDTQIGLEFQGSKYLFGSHGFYSNLLGEWDFYSYNALGVNLATNLLGSSFKVFKLDEEHLAITALSNKFAILKIPISLTSVTDMKDNSNIISPNPAINEINISIEYNRLVIVDINGIIVLENSEYASQVKISHLPSGSYYVRLESENKTIISRLIILH